MNLSMQLHLAAGLGALALGVGVLARDPGRHRNRLFASLCAALAIWNLGVTVQGSLDDPGFVWHVVLLLGGCAAAPLALHFAVVVAGIAGRSRRILLGVGYTVAIALWLLVPAFRTRLGTWRLAALLVLGAILLAALAILFRHVFGLPAGRERRTYRLVLVAGVLAVVGGLSDFLPRGTTGFPKVGPVFVLIFLLMVSAVVVRHRFLDVDVYLARAVALLAGATGVALLLLAVTGVFGARFLPLFLASLLILAAAGPLGRVLLTRARDLLGVGDPLADAVMATSRRLTLARDADQLWVAIEEGRKVLPGEVRIAVYLHDTGRAPFRLVYPEAGPAEPDEVPARIALPLILREERSPITRRHLEVESREGAEEKRTLAAEALREMESLAAEMVVPLMAEARLLGWIAVGGGEPERYVRAEVAAAFLAVGQQAVASLDRIRAMEEARRREALAAVGEMAAGLAHEVRNPVAAIRGAAQAITPEATAEQSGEMLEVIQEETERLGRVVGEFLDYARPASPRCEAVDLGEIVRRVFRGAELAGAGLRTELEVAPDAKPALGDPDQIQRAFENLVRNADEATGPDGALKVRIAPEGSERVSARFEDNGPGIPDDQVAGIFQPFHTTRQGGTGLGLALVHRIVEVHGGEIRVEGRPGRGALFSLTFPAGSSGRMGA